MTEVKVPDRRPDSVRFDENQYRYEYWYEPERVEYVFENEPIAQALGLETVETSVIRRVVSPPQTIGRKVDMIEEMARYRSLWAGAGVASSRRSVLTEIGSIVRSAITSLRHAISVAASKRSIAGWVAFVGTCIMALLTTLGAVVVTTVATISGGRGREAAVATEESERGE